MITRLKHIKSTRKALSDGTSVTYYYHRRTNKRIRGEPGTPEFLENYRKASKSDATKNSSILEGLIEQYKRSQDFARLSPKTRRDYDRYLLTIIEKFGTMPIEVLDDRRIRQDLLKWRDEIGEKAPRQADYAWSVFRRVVQYAVHNGRLTHNHLNRPGRLHKSSRVDKIWLPENVHAFMEVGHRELNNALILALHTGQRKGDLLKLGWNNYDGQALSLRQSKTNRKVIIPVTATLKNLLDDLPRTAMTILTNKRGMPWTADGFNTSWGKCMKKAGVEGLTFHDLRGTAVTILAEQSCTNMEIASITGHSLKFVETILDHYAARTKTLAQAAIHKLEQSWINEVGQQERRTENKQK